VRAQSLLFQAQLQHRQTIACLPPSVNGPQGIRSLSPLHRAKSRPSFFRRNA
jgi:hypothetical protein